MYIDFSKNLPDNLPEPLVRDDEKLCYYLSCGDWLQFDLLLECVEASIKAYQLAGRISEEDLLRLFARYGIGNG